MIARGMATATGRDGDGGDGDGPGGGFRQRRDGSDRRRGGFAPAADPATGFVYDIVPSGRDKNRRSRQQRAADGADGGDSSRSSDRWRRRDGRGDGSSAAAASGADGWNESIAGGRPDRRQGGWNQNQWDRGPKRGSQGNDMGRLDKDGSGYGGVFRGPPPQDVKLRDAANRRRPIKDRAGGMGAGSYEQDRVDLPEEELHASSKQKWKLHQLRTQEVRDSIEAAGTWEALEAALQRALKQERSPGELLGGPQLAWAFHTYCNLAAAAAAADPARGRCNGAPPQEPPEQTQVTQLLAHLLSDALPFLHLRNTAFMVLNLSRAQHTGLSVAGGMGPDRPLRQLLDRTEQLLRHPLSGGGGAKLFAKHEGPDEYSRGLARNIAILCTALQHLPAAPSSLYKAISAAAQPLLERWMSGEQLAHVVQAFVKARNPDPGFLEACLAAAARPPALAAMASPGAAAGVAQLLAGAAAGGVVQPEIINPLADRLLELLKGPGQAQAQAQAGRAQRGSKPGPDASNGTEGANGEAGSSSAGGRPLLTPGRVIHTLMWLATAGCRGHPELLAHLHAEVVRGRDSWPPLLRLQAAQYLMALGVDCLGAPAPAPLAAAPAADASAPDASPAVAAAAPEGSSAGAASPVPTAQGAPAAAAPAAPAAVVTEAEVEQLLRRPELQMRELLSALHALARLRGPAPAVAAAAGANGAATPDGAAPAAAPQARMPSALAVAVELTAAAAPHMGAADVAAALGCLLSVGVAVPPPVIARAQQLYDDAVQKQQHAVQKPPSGSGSGSGSRDPSTDPELVAMCAGVGRVLTWQPQAAAGLLRADFSERCRSAALPGR
ncbi:hypothetical protein HYH03_005147 [Edaphochlamys debaryana]|uniref:Uncharacterized protein n=1 Tax=Edaphochlamys debaryana TaxID=47281 RepID=A0A836C2F2_9CHLO|nr:hypothetical protein HYH03_005147 [Edaphochlamys debaryana]|eukprot:KAG2496737.1 hypothetical protein HYH03_005147 [Edaphochlamys debaryana]